MKSKRAWATAAFSITFHVALDASCRSYYLDIRACIVTLRITRHSNTLLFSPQYTESLLYFIQFIFNGSHYFFFFFSIYYITLPGLLSNQMIITLYFLSFLLQQNEIIAIKLSISMKTFLAQLLLLGLGVNL